MDRQNISLIATFYHFTALADPEQWREQLQERCENLALTGTIVLAHEGINATLCGAPDALRSFMTELSAHAPFGGLRHQESIGDAAPLRRLKVRVRPEIVSLGAGDFAVAGHTGEHVSPAQWNALIARHDVLVIDARNYYETAIGSFDGAIDPHTRHFSDLPEWLLGDARLKDRPPVAMFCTGGIRCEKSTAWLKAQGFEQVYQLQGGILNYLKSVPAAHSRWHGECFVFDERVAVDHALAPGQHTLCTACGFPLKAGQACPETHAQGDPDV